MSRKIIFIGGIHGSGKGTVCEILKARTHLTHLTASEVLKWEEISKSQEKKVSDIDQMQNRLLTNLNKIISNNKTYLLDGHYSLLNKEGVPEKIPAQTFKDIDPSKLILVTADPEVIKNRLEKRDALIYDINLITEFQNLEISFAKEISTLLQISLLCINSEELNLEQLLNFIK